MTQEARELNNKLLELFIAQHTPYQYWDGDTIKAKLTDIVNGLEQLGYHLIPPTSAPLSVNLTLIGDEEINKAFDGAFDKPVNLDHKPTSEEIITIRLRAVAQTQLAHTKREQEIK